VMRVIISECTGRAAAGHGELGGGLGLMEGDELSTCLMTRKKRGRSMSMDGPVKAPVAGS
jgi:hypothetical protein